MVEKMKAGSVIVDMAAEQGGNCELTEPGIVSVKHGVTIIAYTDLPSRLATQSSQLYATNLRHFFTDLTPAKNGAININMNDEVIRGATVTHEGAVTWPPPAPKLSAAIAKPQPAKAAVPAKAQGRHGQSAKSMPMTTMFIVLAAAAAAVFGVGCFAPPQFLVHFTVFVLACFIGYMVIWNVTPSLHTPLMSVTNAISSIIIIGALIQISSAVSTVWILAAIATTITFVNITGGFAVTQRMLKMFRK
jgi:H+-translocating NAD(P) transhydrogenase subunit alpha